MASRKTLTVEILGDVKGLSKALGVADKDVGKWGDRIGGVAKVTGAAFLGMGGAAAAFAPAILATGAELEALGKKSATVFGDSLGQVQDWADTNAKAMGLTSKQATGLAAGLGDLLKPMGFTAKQAAEMSTQTLALAGALSAWSGGQKSAAEVSEVLTAAYLGETDSLKSLGIAISAADIEAKLAEKGQKDLTGAALEQAKALAIQELILAKSTDAQAAWANGSMDSVKAQNESKASIEQLKESLITALYPALQELVPHVAAAAQWLGEHMPGAIERVKGFINDVLVPAFQTIGEWGETVVDWTGEHWDEISGKIEAVVGYVRGAIESATRIISGVWSVFGDTIVQATRDAWDFIKGIVESTMKVIKGVIDVVMGVIRGDWSQAWDGVKGIVSGVWDGIRTLVSGALDGVKALISGAAAGLGAAATAMWEGFKTAASDAANAVVRTIIDLPGRLLNWVGNLASAGRDLGGAILDGFADGIGRVVRGATSIARDFANAIIRFVNTKVIDKVNSFLEFKISVPIGPDITVNPPDIRHIPEFHTGGIYRSDRPGGEGLALLRDREGVFTPEQMRALSTAPAPSATAQPVIVHNHINIDGNLIHTEDVARTLSDAIVDGHRRGALLGLVTTGY